MVALARVSHEGTHAFLRERRNGQVGLDQLQDPGPLIARE
jgi:hypothetical protein